MHDGAVLCTNCVKENYRLILNETIDYSCFSGWRAAGFQVWEGTSEDHGTVDCCHCNAVLVGDNEEKGGES